MPNSGIARAGNAIVNLAAMVSLCLAACQVQDKGRSEPAVTTVNPAYDRIKSHVLVRRIRVPTEGNLDFAAYSKNVMLADPEAKRAALPRRLALDDLAFGGLLRDVKPLLDFTPLSESEKASPLAWTPVLEHLLKWNFESASGLANAYAAVTDERWGDTSDIAVPYQEFASVYLHANGNLREVWVELEFKPWMSPFLEGVQDGDQDGYPSVYARLDPALFTDPMTGEISGDYMGKPLDEAQVIDWARNLASRWYPSYNTDLLPLRAGEAWPYEDDPGAAGKEMGGSRVDSPLFVLQGRPFGDTIFNAFTVDGMGAAKSAAAKRREGRPHEKGLDKGLSARLEAITARIDKEKTEFGGGDWEKWTGRLGPFRADVGKFGSREPSAVMGLAARDGFLVFRRELDYLLAPDWDAPGAPAGPIPAVAAFKDRLAAKGIDFLFVPIPTKLDIYPEYLSGHADSLPGGIAQPLGRKLLRQLAAARVETIDLLRPFLEVKAASEDGKRELYQRQDTHWTTVGLELAARLMAERIRRYSWYDTVFAYKKDYKSEDTVFTSLGDIQARLTDAEKATVAPETLVGRRIRGPAGALYEDADTSQVLVLGDSYTGVYQTVGCRNGGVTAHLAKELGGPVDLIMGWGGGPEAPRKLRKRGEEYLDGKRLVVWMMSSRDLFVYPGGWPAE